MAFQPIFDIRSGKPWAYEALVRGADGTGASDILARVTEQNRYTFDQRCRVTAIEQAVVLGLMDGDARLSINFMPNAVYEPLACIRLTLKTAAAQGLPLSRLIFEFTEQEDMDDCGHIQNIVDSYKKIGLGTALDDFGAGYAGLNRLACLQTDVMKLDMELVRDIDTSMPRRMIVEAMVGLCRNMGMEVVAEGDRDAGGMRRAARHRHLSDAGLLSGPARDQCVSRHDRKRVSASLWRAEPQTCLNLADRTGLSWGSHEKGSGLRRSLFWPVTFAFAVAAGYHRSSRNG